MRLDEFARVSLANLPTPLEEAPRLAEEIGLERLLIKRDDNTGLALGGNKTRKLEYLMADAQASGANVILACGGVQSNHTRMTAAAARKLGMDCILFIPDPMPERLEGNLLLNRILGAEMRFLPGISWTQLEDIMAKEEADLLPKARTPYLIPVGGSTPLGALGYVQAAREISEQLTDLGIEDADIVAALGSGGTLAGIILGSYLFMPEARIIGVSVVLPERLIRPKVERIASEAASLIEVGHEPVFDRMEIYEDYIGEAYGVPTPEAKESILLAARTEGVFLDPVYTGKAMAGLIDLAQKRKIGRGRPVVFWHTGGAPALFAYGELFRHEFR